MASLGFEIMEQELRSLKNMRTMPLPDRPRVSDYGAMYVGAPHYVRLFPAAIRSKERVHAEAALEDGLSTCFFHAQLPATAVCDVSGRMICDLCKTDWEGQTVSFDALQSLIAEGSTSQKDKKRTKWDDIALTLSVLPVLFWPVTLLTAPTALGICLVKFWAGPTSLLRRSRWRYILAGVFASLQIAGWVFIGLGVLTAFNGGGF